MTDQCVSKGNNGLTYVWDDTQKSFAVLSYSYVTPDKVPVEVIQDLMHVLTDAMHAQGPEGLTGAVR